jgi:hypothetical protein
LNNTGKISKVFKEKGKNNFPNGFFPMKGFIGLTLRKSPIFE